METNPKLDPASREVIAGAIRRLDRVATSLPDRPAPAAQVRAFYLGGRDNERDYPADDEGTGDLGAFKASLSGLLGQAAQQVDAHAPDEAVDRLVSAYALTMAKAAEVEMGHPEALLGALGSASGGLATASTAPASASPPAPGWVTALTGLLAKLAGWIWSLIQTLLTPKGWSLEGGVSVPGLAQAKLTVAFGK